MERTWIFGDAGRLKLIRAALLVSICLSALVGVVIGINFHVPLLWLASLVFLAFDVFFFLKLEFLFGITIIDSTLHINTHIYTLSEIRSIRIAAGMLTVRSEKGKHYFMLASSQDRFIQNKQAFMQLRNILMESCNAEVIIESLAVGE